MYFSSVFVYIDTYLHKNWVPNHDALLTLRTFTRLSCVHLQTIVRSSVLPDRVILNARRPLRAFMAVWTYRLSVWDLSLGSLENCMGV